MNSIFDLAEGRVAFVPDSLAALTGRKVNLLGCESEPDPEPEAAAPPETVAPSRLASNAAGVSKSWKDERIARARLTRNRVIVEGHGEFRSTHAAFVALKLPEEKSIRFRLRLKREGVLPYTYAGVTFVFRIEDLPQNPFSQPS